MNRTESPEWPAIESMVGQLLEDVVLSPKDSDGLESSVLFFKKASSDYTNSSAIACTETQGCQKIVRDVILQLKVIEWGIYGLGESSAGMFLAFHHASIGPFYGNDDGDSWPNSPLNTPPTQLELDFNTLMMKITEDYTKGTITDVSILDISAFGSNLASFNKHAEVTNWPTELNFEIYKAIEGKSRYALGNNTGGPTRGEFVKKITM